MSRQGDTVPRQQDHRAHRPEVLLPEQVRAYRRMSPAQRLGESFATTALVRERLRAHLRQRHPEWSEGALRRAVAERFLGDAG